MRQKEYKMGETTMFSFKFGNHAVAKSLAALASGMGFRVSSHYGEEQVSVYNHIWAIVADLEEKYICFSKVDAAPSLKICTSAEEVESEFLNLLESIAAEKA